MKKTPKRPSWNPIHPDRDWRWMLRAFIVLVILVVVWSAYLFISSGAVISGDAGPVESENSTTKQLEYISSFFEKR